MMRCRLQHSRNAAIFLFLAATELYGQSALKIESFTFRQFEGGPSWPVGYSATSGETVAFDFRIAGFQKIPGDFEDKVRLDYLISAVDSKGSLLAEPVKGKIEAEIGEEDKKRDWKPKVEGSIRLPEYLAPGAYLIRVVLEDQVAKSKTLEEFSFSTRGYSFAPAESIAIRDFRFLREETSTEALKVPAYRQGDTVWARFEMVGFSSTKGAVDLAYGLRVSNSAGKVLYEQPTAAEEIKQFFYPPSYLPGIVSLQLQKNTPLGSYTIELTVHDRAAKKSETASFRFSIE